jgi:PadR family transcriptional regulator PadR
MSGGVDVSAGGADRQLFGALADADGGDDLAGGRTDHRHTVVPKAGDVGLGPPTSVLYIYRLVCMRMTGPLQRVLRAFLEDLPAPRYGYDLMRAAGVKSGTLYPLLARLEEDGLVSSGWAVPQIAGQRPRRYYRLTGEGATVARVELARVSAAGRAPVRPGRPAPGSLG